MSAETQTTDMNLLAHEGAAHFFSMEHILLLLNHLPIVGLAMGILALALAMVFVTAASTWPVNFTGQGACKTVRAMTDDDGTDWLDAHMERAEKAAPAFYALAVLTALALFAPRKWPRASLPLTVATLALAVACEGASGWIALAGGRVRHPEFQSEPPPSEPSKPHTH